MLMRLLSPAKINLHLRVAPPNSDGFHPLLSWMTTVGLFDTLTFHASTGTEEVYVDRRVAQSVTLTCTDPNIPCDETNLVAKAVRAFRERLPNPSAMPADVSVHLDKRIPSGGGLGGGSSNAATALLALNAMTRPPLSTEALADAAAAVGSDVAFFIHGPSSVCTGRGERVVPIARPAPRSVVLILPGIAMPTPAVYRKFDELRLGDVERIENHPDWDAWARLPATQLLPVLVNDLEAPAFAIRPDLGELRAQAEQTLGREVRMSGSGSSLFTLYDAGSEAHAAAERASRVLQVQCMAARLAPASDELEQQYAPGQYDAVM